MKKILIAVLLAVIFFVIAAPAGIAYASPMPNVHVTGIITTKVSVTDIKPVGTNNIWTVTGNSTITGDIACSMVENDKLVINPSGKFFGGGQQTFTGTVDGKSGSFTTIMFGDSLASGTLNVTAIIYKGTGALSRLSGEIEYQLTYDSGSDTWVGSYIGSVWFAR